MTALQTTLLVQSWLLCVKRTDALQGLCHLAVMRKVLLTATIPNLNIVVKILISLQKL